MFRGRVRHIHFIGIGGIGMSGLAEILRTMGFEVSGSDLKRNDITSRLETMGIRVFEGHRAENVQNADVVVYSSAIPTHNPEVARARALEIPIISRAEMLAELMRTKYCVTIAGSHGKTTTTSLVATVLRQAGLDPTVVVGGKVNALGSNALLGEGNLFVAEADESDGSFLRFSPTIAVITNIDAEHLDHYGTHEKVKEAFVTFANRIPFYGLGVLCIDHPHVQAILPKIGRRCVTYGVSKQADYRAKNIEFTGLSTSFDVVRKGEAMGRFEVKMPGAHNVLNALSVVAVADELEVPWDVVREALCSFHGVQRRFSIVANIRVQDTNNKSDEVMLVDDYGHHPAEVEATLDAAQRGFTRRVMVAFQPHRYSRTQSLFTEFTRAFNQADVLLTTEVYAAGEAPIEGATGADLSKAIRAHGHHDCKHIAAKADLPRAILSRMQPGDIVIALGAGDINQSVRKVAAFLEQAQGNIAQALELAGGKLPDAEGSQADGSPKERGLS
jgi:UDP-N-acetylmuramate--alanine ligase